MEIPRNDLDDLTYAKELLETPGLAAKITGLFGIPIERGFELLPGKWPQVVREAAIASLRKALDFAVMTMSDRPRVRSSDFIHKIMVSATGAAAGALGFPALSVELPVSTMIMLRSIADVARSEGEHIRLMETKLACLEVFALGGKSPADDATKAGYFAVRVALAGAVSDAVKYIAERGLVEEGAPVFVRLISKIAARFSLVVSEKAAAQAVPVIGAAGGALINAIFMDHFQDMARGHFIVRRLERIYGTGEVRRQYEKLKEDLRGIHARKHRYTHRGDL